MPRPGINTPTIDFLGDLPVVATDGSCIVTDPRGTGRYAYALCPTSASDWAFYRLDLWSRTVQLLTPPARGANTVTARARLLYDPADGTYTHQIWCLAPEGAAPWMRWQRYDVDLDLWTAQANIAGLVAALATDLSLAHLSNLIGIGNNDFIYCNGDGGVFGGAGVSNIARYQISTNTWAVATGAGGARGGAPAIGSSLDILPNTGAALLFSFRGGGSGILDYYDIATDAWAAIAAVNINPVLAWDSEGFETCTSFRYPFRLLVSQGGQINVVDLTPFGAGGAPTAIANELVASIDGADGAVHQGNALFNWTVGPTTYIGIRPHSGKAVQRIRLVL